MEPTDDIGWHAKVNPSEHPLNEFEFDVLVGTDGRRSTIPGFDRYASADLYWLGFHLPPPSPPTGGGALSQALTGTLLLISTG